MNYYYFSFIVILCFEPSAAAREAYLRVRNTREKTTEETKNLNGEAKFPIINGLVQMASQTKIWAHWFRRLLKTLRKWCNAHPHEVKLGKCLASYFSIKIPGLGRDEKNVRYNEGSKVTAYPTETSKKILLKGETFAKCESQNGILKETSIGIHFIFLAQHVFSMVANRFKQYRDFVLSNDLVVCLWDYFWKKFWTWVDSAPDYRL